MQRFARLDPPTPPSLERWSGEEFEAELRAWVEEQVGPVRRMTQVKLRFWATVWRAETDGAAFYAKQNCGLQSFEAALVATLADLAPHAVVPVAGVDLERGFLLTHDQGPVLSETAAEDDLEVWERVVVAAALLQRDLVPHADRLAATGLTTLTSDDAEAYVELRLDDLASRPEGDPLRLDPEKARAVAATLPDVRRWADEVAALGLPVTLNHNDLHENNVFASGDHLRFFDFGDALLTQPLEVLLIPLTLLHHRLGEDPTDARLHRVADAALEVWSDLVPMADLRRALPAALQLGRLCRVESWARCLASADAAARGEWGDAVPLTLAMICDPAPVARLVPAAD